MKNSNFLSWVQIWAYTKHPPYPKMKNSNFLSWVQIWANTEHPPLKMKNSNFLSWVQIWAYTKHPPPHPKMKNSNFLSWVQIWTYTEHPPRRGGWGMWRLYPPRIPSRSHCAGFTFSLGFPLLSQNVLIPAVLHKSKNSCHFHAFPGCGNHW